MQQHPSRREFLKVAGAGAVGLILASCQEKLAASPAPAEHSTLVKTASPTSTPQPSPAQPPTETSEPTVENTPTVQPTKIPETLREAGERIGFRIGNTFYSDDLGAYRPAYKEQSIQHFSAIWSTNEFSDEAIKHYGDEGIRRVLEIANDGKQELVISGFFYRIKIPAEIRGLPDDRVLHEKVEANMRKRLQYVFPYLKNRKKKTYFIGNHETIDIYQGNRLWDTTDIWYRAFGEDVFIRTAEIMYEEAIEAGLEPGKDILFLIGLTDMLFPGPMLDFGMDVYTHTKSALADRLKIPHSQVPLGIAAESHATQTGIVRGHFLRPTRDQMSDALQRMTQEGPVYLTEVELQNATAEEVASYLSDIVTAGYQTGVSGASLWAAIRSCVDQPEPGWCNPEGALFDQGGEPTQVYKTLVSTLNSL